jgi:hypothetical protein
MFLVHMIVSHFSFRSGPRTRILSGPLAPHLAIFFDLGIEPFPGDPLGLERRGGD